jgi:hypothetical protein
MCTKKIKNVKLKNVKLLFFYFFIFYYIIMERANEIIEWAISTGRNQTDTAGMK